ncbi:inactive peptidyl-prolyl cis-trans isomerase FKBP6-like [Saccostrea echinata]|uniref:inactive peptidyl-prolyl cis-trans isomerase FKBP6-like n=1 Tax=Saccostrea echinata TaxID=191078 RepID=UPI002A81006E|nr:inactive peptidyl-prolyl cis-trans isomerase FKBP6-like [Saccostrea echinata]
MEDFEAEDPLVPLVEPIDISGLRVSSDRSGVASHGVEFETSVDFNEPEEKDVKFKAEDIYNNRFLPDDDDSDAEDEDESSPFERMIRKMKDISPNNDGMVYKKIMQQGSGNVVPEGAIVRIHYNAFLEFGDEPFDSTRLRNCPQKVKLQTGGMILGLDWAVSTMKKGELARIIIRPQYAYGEMGTPPRIPKDATELLSEVIAVNDDIELLSEEERQQIPFDDLLKACKSYKQEAKLQFDSSSYRRAAIYYNKAVRMLERAHLKNEEEEDKHQKLLLQLYLNLAICCTKMAEPKRCIKWCKKTLEICRGDKTAKIKALYHYGKALHNQSYFDQAEEKLKQAQRLNSGNMSVNRELAALERSRQKFKMVEIETCKRMFSQPQGITDEEKDKENKRHQEAEERCMEVSEKFRRDAIKYLSDFKNDPDVTEIPFTSYKLTFGEIACMVEEADRLGLKAVEVGSGQNSKIKIVKKRSQEGY